MADDHVQCGWRSLFAAAELVGGYLGHVARAVRPVEDGAQLTAVAHARVAVVGLVDQHELVHRVLTVRVGAYDPRQVVLPHGLAHAAAVQKHDVDAGGAQVAVPLGVGVHVVDDLKAVCCTQRGTRCAWPACAARFRFSGKCAFHLAAELLVRAERAGGQCATPWVVLCALIYIYDRATTSPPRYPTPAPSRLRGSPVRRRRPSPPRAGAAASSWATTAASASRPRWPPRAAGGHPAPA